VTQIIVPQGFVALSCSMYEGACELAERAIAEPEVGPRVRLVIGCVLLCQASLEGHLNEYIERVRYEDCARPEGERENWDTVFAATERASIEDRWVVLPRLLFGRTFDRGAEPFQSFTHLVTLRNELVHWAPETASFDSFPKKRIEALQSKFEFDPNTRMRWVYRVLNAHCAAWACQSVKSMIQRFCTMSGDLDPWSAQPCTIMPENIEGVAPPMLREPPLSSRREAIPNRRDQISGPQLVLSTGQ
jgi:hypothetical protein